MKQQYKHKENCEELSRNKFCRGKAMNITYSEYVTVVSVIQHAMRMRLLYCHLCPVWIYHTCPHYLIKGGF